MGLFLSPDSTSKQKTVTVADTGQYNEKSTVIQGNAKGATGKGASFAESGSILLGDKSKLNLGNDFSGAKLAKNAKVEINSGFSSAALSELVGNLQTSNAASVEAVTGSQTGALAAVQAGMQSALDKIAALVTQKNDATAGNPNNILYAAGLAVVGVALVVYFSRRN